MKLFTKEILKKLPALYTQTAHENPEEEMVFHVKLFTPDSNWTWFIAEYDPEKEIAWGYVMGLENEFGTIDIKELKEVRGPFGFCLLYTSPSPRDRTRSRMPSSA